MIERTLTPVVAGRTYPLFAEFDRVDGIGDQATVVLRGYTVGRVGAIEPRMTDGDLRFRVRMDIEARLATGDLRAMVETVRPATTATIDSITSLLSDSRRLIRDLHGTARVTTPEIRQILARLDTTSILLSHFKLQVTERPYRILTGVSVPQGLEPPPPGARIEPGSPADTVPELREDTTSSGTPRPETGGPMRP